MTNVVTETVGMARDVTCDIGAAATNHVDAGVSSQLCALSVAHPTRGLRDPECDAHPENRGKSSWGGRRQGAGRPKRAIADRLTSGPHWYCGQAYPGQELVAYESWLRMGFDALFPREQVEVERLRGGRRVLEPVVRPFFPSYLFIRLDLALNWRPAACTRGIKRLFGSSPEKPSPVPSAVVEALIARSNEDGIIDASPKGLRLAAVPVGSAVRILEGPFADIPAVCQMSTGDRVHLLIDAICGRLKVVTDRSNVAVAG